MDKKIAKILKLLKIKEIPVVPLSRNLFFVGLYKVTIEMRGDYLVVQVGAFKWDRFSEYLKQNKDYFCQCLTLFSIKNENISISEVVNKLVMLEYLEGVSGSFMTNLSYISKHHFDGNSSRLSARSNVQVS